VSEQEYVAVEITIIARIPGREFREEKVILIPRKVLEECAGSGALSNAFSVVNCVEWFVQRVKYQGKL